MSKLCEYYFAPQSPWAYLGHARLLAMAQRHSAIIEAKPVDMGRLFSVSGGLPLSRRAPQRQAYRLLDLRRWSDFLQIPLNLQPKCFPVSADAAARLIVATQLSHGSSVALAITGAIMQALWTDEKNIADAETLIALANRCGLDGKTLLKSSDTASVQAQYARHTDDAIAASAFGSPWYIVDGAGYWGQDRLDFVEAALSKQIP